MEADRDRFKGNSSSCLKCFLVFASCYLTKLVSLPESSLKNQAAKDAALQQIDLLRSEVETLKRTRDDAVAKSIAIWQQEAEKRVEAASARDEDIVKRLRAITKKITGK